MQKLAHPPKKIFDRFNNISAAISVSITLGNMLLIFSALGCLSARADKEESISKKPSKIANPIQPYFA